MDNNTHLKPLLIRASAGTGKTYQLTGRLLRILLGGAAPDSVIATTFTRKAAGEILTRLLRLLAGAAIDKTGNARRELAEQTGLTGVTAEQCLTLTHGLLRDIHRLRVLTLDSLFSQLARSFSYEIGVPPGWRLSDEIEEMAIRQSAVDAMLDGLPAGDLLAILAQLGKGEMRRSVRDDMLRVINDGYQVSRGSKESAWDSLAVPSEPDETAYRQATLTLCDADVGHKSADLNLRKLGERLALRLWEEIENTDLVLKARALRPSEELTYYRKQLSAEIISALRVAAEGLRTHVLGLLRAQTVATGRVIIAYDVEVNTIKQTARAFSFDDIAHRLAQSLTPYSMDQVATRMDGAIEHLLLDEFQDTAPVQWSVLKPIAKKAASADGDGSFFCVGDGKQAIYGWRGGVAEIFDAVGDQIEGIEQRGQNTSFRSSPVVIEAVNQIFKQLHRHPVATDDDGDAMTQAMRDSLLRFESAFPIHDSARPELSGYVSVRTSDAEGDTAAQRKLTHLRYTVSQVQSAAKAYPACSIGVLTRTNGSVAWLIQMLRVAGVDVSQEGGNPLTDSAAVELVLSCLMMPEHPGDLRWAFHVASSPLAPWLALSDFNNAHAAAGRLRRMVEDDGIARTVETIAGQLVEHCDEGDALRLRQLVYLAQQYETNRGPRIADFVNVVHQKRIEKPRAAQVRVMTIHQAKGLEFDIVVLPELDGDLVRPLGGTIALRDAIDQPPKALLRSLRQSMWPMLPQVWQRQFGDELRSKFTESLCLLYVALTRPRRWLDVIVQPSQKQTQPKSKTASALLYHATAAQCDATTHCQTWFELGDRQWESDQHRPAQSLFGTL